MCTSHLTASCGGFSCSCWDVCSCNMDGNAHYNYTEGSCGSDICDCNSVEGTVCNTVSCSCNGECSKNEFVCSC